MVISLNRKLKLSFSWIAPTSPLARNSCMDIGAGDCLLNSASLNKTLVGVGTAQVFIKGKTWLEKSSPL